MAAQDANNWIMLDLEDLKKIDEKLSMLIHNQTVCHESWMNYFKEINEKLDKILEKL